MKKQRVVIIGHGYTSRLGLIRSLGSDYEIIVVAIVFNGKLGRAFRFEWGKPIDCCSKYVSKFFIFNSNNRKDLIAFLLKNCSDPDQKSVLIPDSDFSVAVVDDNKEVLCEKFIFPNIKEYQESIVYWMDKTVQKENARRIGLNVAEGIVVEVKGGHYELPKNISYPCFTKPLATISGGKQFLRRCNDENELRIVLSKVANLMDTNVLVEDFKKIDTEYAVVGFSDGDKVEIPAIIEFIENSRSHFGIARQGLVRPIDGFEALLLKFKEFVASIGFHGLFDIDFYESSGIMYFGEMNFRFGGSGYAVTKMGCNLPKMMICSFLGDAISVAPCKVTGTATFVNERMCLEDWCFHYISEKECNYILSSSDIHFVYDNDDPGPQRRLKKYSLQQKLKRVIRKLLKK